MSARTHHSSCAIQADDGLTKCILILGGQTNQETFSKSTEIFNINDQKWIQGPSLPFGVKYAACVALPPTSNFACALIGGKINDKELWEQKAYSLRVHGLNKALTKWSFLGKISEWPVGAGHHIALALS